ncbi:hypothetical protein [Pelagibacterium halotolerans]|uniref:hypothetical protein n=1 Tax=Pelagibacterium halotolerans TaxID=531813 RepID=UPI00384A9AF2
MSAVETDDQPLPQRLWTYTTERFPLAGNGFLTALMCAGSIAPLGSEAPLWKVVLSVFAVLPLFFIMRVADEHKDYHDDLVYRPERAVPRGLISLGELRTVAAVAALVPPSLAIFVSPNTIVPLILAVAWIAAMSLEFGVKNWLRARPVLYLVSHMLAMPLLALVAISFADPARLLSGRVAIILLLAFAAGLVLEVGRKLWAPSEEREGVETYSKLWGVRTAAIVWLVAAGAALMLGALASGYHPVTLGAALVAFIAATLAVLRYLRTTNATRAKQMRFTAVLATALAYGLAVLGAPIQ